MIATLDFKAPLDLIEEVKPLATPPAGVAPLVGTWHNVDKHTRGVVRFVIGAAKTGINVHLFGACHPTPCDWGAVNGMTYAPDVTAKSAMAFTAHYKFDFKETIVTGNLNRGTMTLETFTRFTDKSNRSDYYSKEYFRQ
jgi:hypothetical protein